LVTTLRHARDIEEEVASKCNARDVHDGAGGTAKNIDAALLILGEVVRELPKCSLTIVIAGDRQGAGSLSGCGRLALQSAGGIRYGPLTDSDADGKNNDEQ
jgi:hypothetical protein